MEEDESNIEERWQALLNFLEKTIGKRPADLNAVMFLIGVQELGQGVRQFTKEQKQDLMHIAICRVLSKAGFYELEGLDKDGWPHWKLVNKLPHVDLLNQEHLLKIYVLDYFEDEGIL
ncbi:hypothetical protein [uncultured Microscilla sp.]|uniref:hypothetical protein n=1 Tax=uncultured Microscilla sp. TaxID=432653 RepID=UPI002616896D|nr:hypothetical protein [uncultured Microscilla sp.]